MRRRLRMILVGLAGTLACAGSSPARLTPTTVAASAGDIQSIRVARFGSTCTFTIDDPSEISEIASHFVQLRAGTANEYRTFLLRITQAGGAVSDFTLGDDWVLPSRTGHTYQTSAWRFRSARIFTVLDELAEARCN